MCENQPLVLANELTIMAHVADRNNKYDDHAQGTIDFFGFLWTHELSICQGVIQQVYQRNIVST